MGEFTAMADAGSREGEGRDGCDPGRNLCRRIGRRWNWPIFRPSDPEARPGAQAAPGDRGEENESDQ